MPVAARARVRACGTSCRESVLAAVVLVDKHLRLTRIGPLFLNGYVEKGVSAGQDGNGRTETRRVGHGQRKSDTVAVQAV